MKATEEQIKQATREYLANLPMMTGSESLNKLVEEANAKYTIEGYKELLKQLRSPEHYNRFVQYKGNSVAFSFVDNLSKILVGQLEEEIK